MRIGPPRLKAEDGSWTACKGAVQNKPLILKGKDSLGSLGGFANRI
jgi:hypothetical protein